MDHQFEDRFGCGLTLLAYTLGSYLFGLVLLVVVGAYWWLLIAPVSLPALLCLGLLLLGGGEVATTVGMVALFSVGWLGSIVACRGLLRCWQRRTVTVWPIIVLAAVVALAAWDRLWP